MTWMPAHVPAPLDERRVHVWRAFLDRSPCEVEAAALLLSEDEQARAARFRVAAVRDRFTVCRAILRRLAGMYAAVPPASLRFGYREHGKPYLDPTPGPRDIRFNLSHSHSLALFAFAVSREVGVDLEMVRPERDHQKLAARFFSSREVAALQALAPEERSAAFFQCWTRKEAYLKARGEGLAIPLASFSVSVGPALPPQLIEVEGDPTEASYWSMALLEPDPAYAATLAVQGSAAPLDLFDFPATGLDPFLP